MAILHILCTIVMLHVDILSFDAVFVGM